MSVPELRPLGIGEILDVALKIGRRHFGTLARIVVVIVVPLEIISSLLITSVTADEMFLDPATGAQTVDGGDAAAAFAGIMVAVLVSGLAFLLSSAATLRAVSIAYLGGQPDWQESVRVAVSRLGGLIWLAILLFFGVALGFVLLVLPGIWLSVAWTLGPVVLVAEDRLGLAALGRSFRLVRGRWWPTFGVLTLAFILQSIAEQIIALPFALVSPEAGSFGAFVGLAISSIVASVVTTPFVAAVFVLVYFDLRVRKEGFDVELLVRAMDGPGDGLPPTGDPQPGYPPPVPPGYAGYPPPSYPPPSYPPPSYPPPAAGDPPPQYPPPREPPPQYPPPQYPPPQYPPPPADDPPPSPPDPRWPPPSP